VELAGHIASLNSVLDDLPVSVTVWDANLCNVYANAMHGRWSGMPPHEMLGRRLDSLLRSDRFGALKPHLDAVLEGRAATYEGHFMVVGEDRRLQVQLIPHGSEGGRVAGFAALTIDVTAERHAQALRGRLAALVEHTDDAILGLALDGSITDWNEGATRLFGHTEAEALGRPCAALLGDPDDAALRQRIARLVGGDPVAPFETELSDRGGGTVPVSVVMSPIRDSEHRVIGVAKTLRDIRRLRETEKALRDSRAFLDRTGRIAGVGGWEIDLRSEQVTWSAEVCRIHERPLGHRLDVSEGLGYFNRDARRRLREALAAALAGAGPFDLEAQMTTATGRSVWVRMAGTLEYENGLPVRCVGAMQDITEQLARRNELQREHELRVQLQRHAEHLDELLNERSDMLRVLAHEVRQPLNNASAALQSAAAALAGSGRSAVADRLQRARDVMGHVLAGVDNTLAAASLLAGSGQATGEDTDIDTLVAVALADLPANDRARAGAARDQHAHGDHGHGPDAPGPAQPAVQRAEVRSARDAGDRAPDRQRRPPGTRHRRHRPGRGLRGRADAAPFPARGTRAPGPPRRRTRPGAVHRAPCDGAPRRTGAAGQQPARRGDDAAGRHAVVPGALSLRRAPRGRTGQASVSGERNT
jgi:PAS domain S-box-containing protein